MRNQQKRPRITKAVACLLASLSAVTFTFVAVADRELPDRFSFSREDGFSFVAPFLTARPHETAKAVSTGETTAEYDVSLLGVIPVKTVAGQAATRQNVTVSGQSFGIRLYSDGAMVVGLTELETQDGACSPSFEAGLRQGDIITAVDGSRITENGQIVSLLAAAGGNAVSVDFTRNGKAYHTTLSPVKVNGTWKAGMWVRDSVAGIGTLTYFDGQSNVFAGLGHGITDAESGGVYPLFSGSAVLATVTGVKKGEVGLPGELKGYFTDTAVGDLFANTEQGVFGSKNASFSPAGETLPVAFRQETAKGAATLYCDVGDGVKGYAVEVEKIRLNERAPTRNMVVRVTDERLLARTGGIVQGMSGSPLVQNGRLIGAVTHVFVNDPTRGYAIFAENMLDAAESLLQDAA